MDPILQAIELCKQVDAPEGRIDILSVVNLSIPPGASVAITGSSGSGKSTLLSLLAGLDTPSSGDVMLHGHSLKMLDEDGRAKLRAGQVGFVFQAFQLVHSLNALENVMLPLELAGQADARALALEVLSEVGLAERTAHYPGQLSGGEQQRVAIARAYATRPLILFADEPTGNLDQRTGAHIMDLLFTMNAERDTTLVLVTHDISLADRCDSHYRLEAGRLGPPE
jgi:putative ABC transport system ATP-binding protein